MYTPFGGSNESNVKNEVSSVDQSVPRVTSMIALGNPIIDISAEVGKDIFQKFCLQYGRTGFSNESINFEEMFRTLEQESTVSYTPGGSIQNTLRVASWCLNMDDKNKNSYKLTMLGSVGEDLFKQKILYSLKDCGVTPLLETIPNIKTSRCGVFLFDEERISIPDIQASKELTKDFIVKNETEILNHDSLLIEGYFIKENYEICMHLCYEFSSQKKLIILSLSNPIMIKDYSDKIIEIANRADMIIGNMEEAETFAGVKGLPYNQTFDKIHRKLARKERILVVTAGKQGVFCSKFSYRKMQLDFILQNFPSTIKKEEIVDLNGAGDAFLGGFIAQYLCKKTIYSCCRVGNDAAYEVMRNRGCTFKKNVKINLEDGL